MEMSLMPNTGMVMNTNVFSYGFGVRGKDEAGRIYICAIFEGSPAERAGLEVGDEIKKIYSNSNMELTYKDLLNLIKSEENQTIKLLISGQTGEREVVLNKAMLLPEVD
jgi:C-terminal processing protease CtpA/Prc